MGEKLVLIRVLNPNPVPMELNLTGDALGDIIFPPNGSGVYSVPREKVAAITAAGFKIQVL